MRMCRTAESQGIREASAESKCGTLMRGSDTRGSERTQSGHTSELTQSGHRTDTERIRWRRWRVVAQVARRWRGLAGERRKQPAEGAAQCSRGGKRLLLGGNGVKVREQAALPPGANANGGGAKVTDSQAGLA